MTIKEDENKNLLENGEYVIVGPDNGNIEFHKIILKAGSGAERVWKVKSLSKKEIILEIEKFG